jgi:hypothetical protein
MKRLREMISEEEEEEDDDEVKMAMVVILNDEIRQRRLDSQFGRLYINRD